MSGSDEVVLGVDVGTTATKVIAYDTSGAMHASASESYPLEEPEPGAAVQDPDGIVAAVHAAVRKVAGELGGPGLGRVSRHHRSQSGERSHGRLPSVRTHPAKAR